MAFKKGLKASDEDNVLIRASASLQESMSESLRFTASHLVNVVDYEISSENTPRPDTFIIGFPLRGDCRNEKYVNSNKNIYLYRFIFHYNTINLTNFCQVYCKS